MNRAAPADDNCCPPQAPTGPFDVAVVGAGSAGFSAAITAAGEGARVILIGHGTLGGTCVNVGCVPSKTMIRAVEVLHHARAAARFGGITAEAHITDWQALVARKQALVDELRAAKYTDVLPEYENITYLEAVAHLDARGRLHADGKVIETGAIILATGSHPHVPNIAGLDGVAPLDSTSALELSALPASLLVMGGGYVGVEMAQMFARAGVKVTIATRHGLLPSGEPEIATALTGFLTQEGLTVLNGLGYERISGAPGKVVLHAVQGGAAKVLRAERLLLATGRVPNTAGLGLEAAGVETDARGGIVTDARMRTSRAGIFAAGDVTGRDQFVYMAAYGAKLAAMAACGRAAPDYDNATMPAVVFCDPQVASVGLTEAQAASAGLDVVTSVLGLEHIPRALAARDTRGLIKLVAERATHKLLGAHILAPEGADSIQTAAMALRAELSYDELGAMIFPYLTTVEGLKLAAQTFEMDVAKLSCCAG